jgi:hypothetical protein
MATAPDRQGLHQWMQTRQHTTKSSSIRTGTSTTARALCTEEEVHMPSSHQAGATTGYHWPSCRCTPQHRQKHSSVESLAGVGTNMLMTGVCCWAKALSAQHRPTAPVRQQQGGSPWSLAHAGAVGSGTLSTTRACACVQVATYPAGHVHLEYVGLLKNVLALLHTHTNGECTHWRRINADCRSLGRCILLQLLAWRCQAVG